MTAYKTQEAPSPAAAPAEHCLQLDRCQVFFDFDNTITSFDVLDGIIEKFSINHDWIAYEEAWKKGRIGSRQCLEGQLRSIRVDRRGLEAYLKTVAVDAAFQRLLALLRRQGVRPVIVSDSFSQLINFILDHNGIRGVPVYANRLRLQGDRLLPSFPRAGADCGRCGHCKTHTIAGEEFAGRHAIYIGDGLSDLCPARRSALVFAKRGCSLQHHLLETGAHCLPFDDLGDIYRFFKEFTDERNTLTVFAAEPASAV